MGKEEFLQIVEQLIIENEIDKAFNLIKDYLGKTDKKGSDIYYDLITLQTQYNANSKNWDLSIETDKEERNKIIHSVTRILKEIKSGEFSSVLQTRDNQRSSSLIMLGAVTCILLLLGTGAYFSLKKMISNNSNRKEYVLVSANKLWTNTGFVVKPGEKVRIRASGLVNMALHRVIEAAYEDTKSKYPWVGPEGLSDMKMPSGPLYQNRKKLRVEPQAPYGCLLFYARLENAPDPSIENISPPGILIYKDGDIEYEHPHDAKKDATIFLTCNDTALRNSPDSKNMYVGTQKEINETYGYKTGKNGERVPKYTVAELEKRWDNIISIGHYEIWFDDNGGQFLAKIEFLNSN